MEDIPTKNRKIIGELKSISKEIDPGNKDHISAFFEACSIFSIGLQWIGPNSCI